MSYLTDHPELMVEVIAALVRRQGGSVTVTKEDLPGPFNLLSKFDDGGFHIAVEDVDTPEGAGVRRMGSA